MVENRVGSGTIETKSFVFVSHAAPDKRTHVRPLVHTLAIEGVALWLDRPGSGPNDFQLSPDFVSRYQIQSLRLGQDWDDGIESALRDAGAVLVCMSKAALEPGREVLLQEMWGAQLTRKAVTCIIDDLDLATVPPERGLLSLGKSQSLRIAAGADDRTLRLWDPAHPAEALVFEGHSGSVKALAVLPDGRILRPESSHGTMPRVAPSGRTQHRRNGSSAIRRWESSRASSCIARKCRRLCVLEFVEPRPERHPRTDRGCTACRLAGQRRPG